ncbi:MAG: Na+/H+ antiporter [Planctomycetes bacterium]|nr:Na+/H+ antiporter [Planctomycetota bacterium]
MSETLNFLTLVLATLGVVTLLAPRLRLPQPLALALAGVGLAFVPQARAVAGGLDPNLILLGFLPPLLYADAWQTSWRDFHRWLRPILMLAIGLVALTILTVGLVAKWCLPELPWVACFLLGAVVSPTDTVAVQAVIERLRVPRRMTAIVGGESLVNDATGLVGVQIAVVVALQGVFTWGGATVQFAWVAGLGVVIGVGIGIVFALANRLVRDPAVAFTVSLLAPYLAFALATVAQVSGVLAVVVAGAVVAWRVHYIAPSTRVQLRATWGQLTFLLNGLCFLYIGIQSPCLLARAAQGGAQLWQAGLAVTAAVVLTRIAWCWPNAYLPLWLWPALKAREGGYPSPKGVLLVSWCGVRGAVSLAAALSLPTMAGDAPFPGRDQIIACTLAVILATLVLQGGTLFPLVRLLGLRDDGTTAAELRAARERLLESGIARLDAFCSEQSCPVAVHRFREAMVEELASLRADDEAERTRAAQRLAVSRDVRVAVAEAQERALVRLRDAGAIDDQAYSSLLAELDHVHLRDVASTAAS